MVVHRVEERENNMLAVEQDRKRRQELRFYITSARPLWDEVSYKVI